MTKLEQGPVVEYHPIEGSREISLAFDPEGRDVRDAIALLYKAGLSFHTIPVQGIQTELNVTGMRITGRGDPTFFGIKEIGAAVKTLLEHPEDESITYFPTPKPLP